MTMYSPEETRKEAANLDLNHPGWWKVAAMLRQGADDFERLEWLLTAIPRHAFTAILPDWYGDLESLVTAIDEKRKAA